MALSVRSSASFRSSLSFGTVTSESSKQKQLLLFHHGRVFIVVRCTTASAINTISPSPLSPPSPSSQAFEHNPQANMMNKWRKPNPAQSDHLKSYMADHPQLAKSNVRNDAGKKTAEAMWAKLTVALNSLGPPSRDKFQWKKTWADYKSQMRKRVRDDANAINKTDGGGDLQIHQMSVLDEQVCSVLSLHKTAGLSGKKFGALSTVENNRCGTSAQWPKISNISDASSSFHFTEISTDSSRKLDESDVEGDPLSSVVMDCGNETPRKRKAGRDTADEVLECVMNRLRQQKIAKTVENPELRHFCDSIYNSMLRLSRIEAAQMKLEISKIANEFEVAHEMSKLTENIVDKTKHPK